ncbi:hypothetical protein [Sandaracinus amylolyticus]|uniref:Alpha-mannosidase n=1 Tax=Sandaracinus amylolyticus TaxID=927083 RepID=A0A0F6YGK3_9BACT|nr:hypothetical protein [Sandaracinus amylolyticus]AKF04788.1 Alpha-mannosidase [Sandaracinus amylolyticus]
MIRSFLIAVVALCGLAACGSNEEASTTETTGTAPATTTTPTPTPPPTTPTPAEGTTAAPGAAAAGGGATITIATGFTDPTITTGTSGGAVEASTLNSECAGWVSSSPDHVIDLQAAMPRLKIMAFGTEADSDVTLVVRKPDGTYLCNDDSDGFHPVVEGEMPAGRYEVFVGSYEQGRRRAYRLGITTQEAATPTTTLAQAQ